MDYSLRARPDGQTEIVELRPTVVATFADEATALRVLAFLQTEAGGPAPVAAAEPGPAPKVCSNGPIRDEASEDAWAVETARRALVGLPAVVATPAPPAAVDAPTEPTDEDWQRAFDLIASGEKIAVVAQAMNVPWTQLRGKWAAHSQKLQKAAAEAGQAECTICARPFTPSLSSPDKCARCARD